MADEFVYTTEPAHGFLFVGRVSDEMVESVMRDLMTAQVEICERFNRPLRDQYLNDIRDVVRDALTKALALASRDQRATDSPTDSRINSQQTGEPR